MHRVVKYLHDNRNKIVIIVFGIILFFIVTQALNNMVINRSKDNIKLNNTSENVKNNSSSTEGTTTINKSIYFSTSGEPREQQSKHDDVIEQFLKCCNNSKIEDAYNLLSNNCKEVMFDSLEKFKENYYDNYFDNGKKSFNITSWDDYTYKVDISEDSLASGKINKNGNMQDFITIEKEDNTYKLNINGFIKTREVNKSVDKSNVKVTVEERNIFKTYEEYRLKISNNSNNDIIFNKLEKLDTIYIQNSNDIKYKFAMSEVPKSYMKIRAGQEREISIKFYREYSSSNRITEINFNDVVVDDNNLINFKIRF